MDNFKHEIINFNDIKAYSIRITGLVQGVGMRPFIYKVAREFEILGSVENRIDGVFIEAECRHEIIESFVDYIQKNAPPASHIFSIEMQNIPRKNFRDFKIIDSSDSQSEITQVSPDIAVCSDCLVDMKSQPHRYNYPFINCTNCGPRFTIIRDLPYDREQTTMSEFEMCYVCNSEYGDITDRRFHAQPIACRDCGPQMEMFQRDASFFDPEEIVTNTATIIDNEGIVAVKGLGGFFLACDAMSDPAVNQLREVKTREKKPFAVMFRDLTALEKNVYIDEIEKKYLTDTSRPIVILKQTPDSNIAASVSPGLNTVGTMLPYMPFHYLLFEKLKTDCIVFTSGNFASEPIIREDELALNKFLHPDISIDAVITYNREISNRCDDSVMFVVEGKRRMIRRSRGFVPTPVRVGMDVSKIFAAGAELSGTFAIGSGNNAILSQYIGDLKNLETLEFYEEAVEKFLKLFKVTPEIAVCDYHPDYFSTRYAEYTNLPLIKVQHHHAHIASCMAEHNIKDKVLGLSFDGTGLGTDNTIWGGEFLVADYESFERVANFEAIPMPGGDKASHDTWRSAFAYLHNAYGADALKQDLPLFDKLEPIKLQLARESIEKSINAPLCSSVGRIFDAVGAIVFGETENRYQAELPMRLESLVDWNDNSFYFYDFSGNQLIISEMIRQIVTDIHLKQDISVIATKFHNTIAEAACYIAGRTAKKLGLKNIVLTGGVFQNRYLSYKVFKKLSEKFDVYMQESIPASDSGIALGQLAVAAYRRSKNVS